MSRSDLVACSSDTAGPDDFNRLVAEIYASITHAEGFAPLIGSICHHLGCLSGVLAVINTETGEYIGGWQYGHKQEHIQIHIENGFIHQDPLVQRTLRSPLGKFIKVRETMTWDAYTQLDIYKVWGKKLGLYDAAGTILTNESKTVTGIFFQRSSDQGLFTDENVALLDRLVPHLQQALRLYLRLMEHDISNRPLKEALDLIRTPTVLFDRRGVVVFANRSARELTKNIHWISLNDQFLAISNSKVKSRFNKLLSKTVICSYTEEGYDGGIINAEINGERLAFCLQPMNSPNDTETHGGALLFIHQQKQTIDESKIYLIADMFQLTRAEAQVSLLLAQGMNIDAVANFTGRKVNTVRAQLKSVYAKTGVNTQGQLVSLLLASPVFLT